MRTGRVWVWFEPQSLYTSVYIYGDTDIDSSSTHAFWNKEDVGPNLILEVS